MNNHLQNINLFSTSKSIEETPDAIIDILLDEYGSKVKHNLAPGATFFGLERKAREQSFAELAADEKSDTLSKYGDVIGNSSLRTLWSNVIANGNEFLVSFNNDLSSLKTMDQLFPLHEFMITAGANQGFINIITALCDPGDEVILILPYYFSHYNALVMNSIKPMCVPVDTETMLPDLDIIKSHITKKTRALVVVNPGNPSGVIYPVSLLEQINEICQKLSIWLIIDEAYREFNYANIGIMTPTIHLQAHLIKLFTMSKAYGLAGWRVGGILYPRHISRAMRKAQDTIPTHATRFSQVVAYHALRVNPFGQNNNNGGHILELDNVRKIFICRLEQAYESYLSRIRFVIPNGAFYVFIPYVAQDKIVNMTRDDDMSVVKTLAMKFGVLVCPGFAFGMNGYIRVSYGTVQLEHAHAAADMLSEGISYVLQSFEKV